MFCRTSQRDNSRVAIAQALTNMANYDNENECLLAFLRLSKETAEDLLHNYKICGHFKFSQSGCSQYVFKPIDITENDRDLINAIEYNARKKNNAVFFIDFPRNDTLMYPFTFICGDEEYKIEMISKTYPLENTCGIYVISRT